MKTFRGTLPIFVLVMTVAALASACGGGGSETAAPSAAASSASEPAGAEPASAGAPAEAAKESGDPEAGRKLFGVACASCHGANGEGVEGSGVPLVGSEYVAKHAIPELVEYVKHGRTATDPENKTGIEMPPKGGNPWLTDAQILDIVTFVKTDLQEQ